MNSTAGEPIPELRNAGRDQVRLAEVAAKAVPGLLAALDTVEALCAREETENWYPSLVFPASVRAAIAEGLDKLENSGAIGTALVPWIMAMNLRIPEELDRQLEQLAAEEHTSKSSLLLQGAELVLQRAGRRRDIDAGLEFITTHDAELLERLADA